MTLTAIPEEVPCCFVDVGCKGMDASQQKAGHLNVNIKHTFIELVVEPSEEQRMRAFSDGDEAYRREFIESPLRVPADLHEVVGKASPIWASPCWGPSGDLFYANSASDEFMSLPPADTMSESAGQGYSWMVPPEFLWGHDVNANQGKHVLTTQMAGDACFAEGVAKTTIILRNLPREFKRSNLIEILEDEGFEGSYDLVYVPMDFNGDCSLGYAFVNFISEGDASRCWVTFDGFSEWGVPCEQACEVLWSNPHQGLDALIERYRNSPVMHGSMPEEWKPAYFVDGTQVLFPAPTKEIKAPKAKNNKSRAKKQQHQSGEAVFGAMKYSEVMNL